MSDEFRDQHWESNFSKRTRKWIGYFDILGFKEYIYETDLLKAVKEVEDTFRAAIEGAALKSTCSTISSKGSENPILKRYTFSDSIIFFIDPWIEMESAFYYMVEASAILIAKFIERNFLLRGAISFGQIECKYNANSLIVIGKGVVDSYKWESAQRWAGCVINPEMSDVWRVLSNPKSWAFSSLEKNGTLREYNVPLKIEIKQGYKLYAINWTKYITPCSQINVESFLKNEMIKKVVNFIAQDMTKNVNEECEAFIKLKNTLNFMENAKNDNK